MFKKLSLVFITSVLTVSAGIESNLANAQQYAGNFYKYHTEGDWSIFSDLGVSLGEAVPLFENVQISYYVNPDEDYVIQYYRDESNMTYAIWQDNTVSLLSSSKY